jgi:hypothetical protein
MRDRSFEHACQGQEDSLRTHEFRFSGSQVSHVQCTAQRLKVSYTCWIALSFHFQTLRQASFFSSQARLYSPVRVSTSAINSIEPFQIESKQGTSCVMLAPIPQLGARQDVMCGRASRLRGRAWTVYLGTIGRSLTTLQKLHQYDPAISCECS